MTFGKKNLRFLLIPFKVSDYDLKQLKKIKKTLKILNVQSQIFDQKYSEEQLKIFLKNNSFDIIFAINKGRPNWLNKKIRFISWFQDFYFDSDSLLENFLESDIVYFYASPEAFEVSKKLNCFTSMLYPGIDDEHKSSILAQHGENYNLINDYQVLDFSICGYMPCSLLVPHYESHFRNYSFKENHLNDQRINNWFSKLTHKNEKKYSIDIYKEFIVDLQIIVETNYVPLSGDLQVKKIALKIKKKILEKFNYINSTLFNQIIPFLSTDYARFLDRIELARLLSKHSFNFGIFGEEWSSYPEFELFVGNHISKESELYEIYKKSKINLYNNTHGLGMHSKVFEVMLNGAFLAIPKSKKNFLRGGINEEFNENEHFVTYTSEQFDDLIENWMFDTKKRIEVGENARKLVLSKHTWKKRIEKILKDIER